MISGPQMIGTIAAVRTTVSYVPQLYKCWTKGTAADLSLYMLLVLSAGLALGSYTARCKAIASSSPPMAPVSPCSP